MSYWLDREPSKISVCLIFTQYEYLFFIFPFKMEVFPKGGSKFMTVIIFFCTSKPGNILNAFIR